MTVEVYKTVDPLFLGWSNTQKIRAYQEELDSKGILIKELEVKIDSIKSQGKTTLSNKRDSLRDLLQYSAFGDINFKKAVVEIND